MDADIERLVNSWADAERSGDAGRLDGVLTDDFVGIGPVGFVLPKDAWLSRFAQGMRYERLELEETFARTHGDATLVVARQRAAGENHGNPTPADTRVSLTVVRDSDGAPRIAGIQYSFMAPAPSVP